MTQDVRWRKSSYSGGGDGNTCVEVAHTHPHISIRDSKAPTRATLTFPATAFAPFIEALKTTPSDGRDGCFPR